MSFVEFHNLSACLYYGGVVAALVAVAEALLIVKLTSNCHVTFPQIEKVVFLYVETSLILVHGDVKIIYCE